MRRVTPLALLLAVLIGAAAPSPAQSAECRAATPGCAELAGITRFATDVTGTSFALFRRFQAVRARAGKAPPGSAGRRAFTVEQRRTRQLLGALRSGIKRQTARWRRAPDVPPVIRAVGFRALGGVEDLLDARIAETRQDLSAGSSPRRERVFRRAAAIVLGDARRTTARTPRWIGPIDDEDDLLSAWTVMRSSENTILRVLEPRLDGAVPQNRTARRGKAAVIDAFQRAYRDLVSVFQARLERSTGLGPLVVCRDEFFRYGNAAEELRVSIKSYSKALRDGRRLAVRRLDGEYRDQREALSERRVAVNACIKSVADGPGAGSRRLLPIDDASRSGFDAQSARSVRIAVAGFPANAELEVRVFRPDGALVPGFNGPSAFPAALRADASGSASELYGIVRSTSPLGEWRVEVEVAGRPLTAVTGFFRVIP